MQRSVTLRKLVRSVTLKDCRVDLFRASGPGGQNRNKRDTAVRIVHAPSGAKGEAKEHKSQLQNKKAAFKRMAESVEFKLWADAIVRGEISVEEAMQEKNLKIETQDEDGKWVALTL